MAGFRSPWLDLGLQGWIWASRPDQATPGRLYIWAWAQATKIVKTNLLGPAYMLECSLYLSELHGAPKAPHGSAKRCPSHLGSLTAHFNPHPLSTNMQEHVYTKHGKDKQGRRHAAHALNVPDRVSGRNILIY